MNREKGTKIITIEVNKETHTKIRKIAKEKGMLFNSYMRKVVENLVNEKEK